MPWETLLLAICTHDTMGHCTVEFINAVDEES